MSSVKLNELKVSIRGIECKIDSNMYIVVIDDAGVAHSALPSEITVELPDNNKTISLAELLGQAVKTIEFK